MKRTIFLLCVFACILSLMAQQHNTGKITAVENGKIYISIGEGQAYPGDRFIVVTNNEYFTHPVTGAFIPKNGNPNAIIEIETVFKDFSQAKPISDTDIYNIKTGMQIEFKDSSAKTTAPSNEQEEFESEEEYFLKTQIEAINMNCPQKLSKDQTLEKIELTNEAMIHYYTCSKKAYKIFSKEKVIKKSVNDLTKSYRKEMKKDSNASLRKMLTALLNTNRYIEYVYYNQDHTEYFSYIIDPKDVFNGK